MPGRRKHKVKKKHPGAHKGKAHPRKRRRRRPRHHVPPVVEQPNDPYPTFGYTVVVESVKDSERAILTDSPRTYVPGNMIEYYGPAGMPVTSTFFMSGMKEPVKPGETWTDSFYFFWKGVDQAATPLKAVLKDREGRVIEDYGAFEGMAGVTGNSSDEPDADANGYVRRWLTMAVPDSATNPAAYIELVSGGCGDGLFRVMGPQHERGSVMTEWTDDHSTSGSQVSTFQLGIVGIPPRTLPDLAKVKRFVRIAAEVTHHESGATSHVTEARVKPSPEADYSDWTDDPDELPVEGLTEEAIVQVRTTLFTANLDYTPEFHDHFVEFERDLLPGFGVLCRADGSEFDGSATVYDFQPVRPQKPILEETYADNSGGFGVMGKTRQWASLGVEVYTNDTAEEFMGMLGAEEDEEKGETEEDASVLTAEVFGTRYRLRILSAEVVAENREAHVPIPGQEDNGRWNLRAEGIQAEVMGEEEF